MKGRESKVDRAGWLQIVIHSEPKKEKKRKKRNKNTATKKQTLKGNCSSWDHQNLYLQIFLTVFSLEYVEYEYNFFICGFFCMIGLEIKH